MADEKTKTNALIGRLMYRTQTDAAGYPNGMPYWPEMPANNKYFYAAMGVQFIEMLAEKGLITINRPLGFGDNAMAGQGECQALVDFYTETGQKELEEFQERLAKIKAMPEK